MIYGFIVAAWLMTGGNHVIAFASLAACEAAKIEVTNYYRRGVVFCLPTGVKVKNNDR